MVVPPVVPANTWSLGRCSMDTRHMRCAVRCWATVPGETGVLVMQRFNTCCLVEDVSKGRRSPAAAEGILNTRPPNMKGRFASSASP